MPRSWRAALPAARDVRVLVSSILAPYHDALPSLLCSDAKGAARMRPDQLEPFELLRRLEPFLHCRFLNHCTRLTQFLRAEWPEYHSVSICLVYARLLRTLIIDDGWLISRRNIEGARSMSACSSEPRRVMNHLQLVADRRPALLASGLHQGYWFVRSDWVVGKSAGALMVKELLF